MTGQLNASDHDAGDIQPAAQSRRHEDAVATSSGHPATPTFRLPSPSEREPIHSLDPARE
jgi:hypothetical protein